MLIPILLLLFATIKKKKKKKKKSCRLIRLREIPYNADKVVIVFSVSTMRSALFIYLLFFFFFDAKRCAKLYFTYSYSNWFKKHKHRQIINNINSIFQQITNYKRVNKHVTNYFRIEPNNVQSFWEFRTHKFYV